MNIMKKIILAAAFSLFATSAFAGATLNSKDTNSHGSAVGQASSGYKGNGDVIGGNGNTGTSGVAGDASDQTTSPGSRSAEVHEVLGK
jgi:hypothetical protein